MDQCDFKIFTGVDNRIEFSVRDLDRQPQIPTGHLEIVIGDRYGRTVIGQFVLQSLDNNPGVYYLNLTAEDTSQWPIEALSYNVMVVSDAGQRSLLYVDQWNQARGFIEVVPSMFNLTNLPGDITT